MEDTFKPIVEPLEKLIVKQSKEALSRAVKNDEKYNNKSVKHDEKYNKSNTMKSIMMICNSRMIHCKQPIRLLNPLRGMMVMMKAIIHICKCSVKIGM